MTPTQQPKSASAGLALQGVARRFGRSWALRGVSLDVEPGEVVGLIGKNGSGKTTLLRVVATLLRPTRGGGRVWGHDLRTERPAVRGLIGLLGHTTGLYEDLTAAENLAFAARMRGLRARPSELAAALDRAGLGQDRGRRVRTFSSGMRRRLALARLLLAPPRLLLLDEPYASFDSEGIALLEGFVRGVVEGGGAALVATHDVPRSSALVHRFVGLEGGRVAAEGPKRGPLRPLSDAPAAAVGGWPRPGPL